MVPSEDAHSSEYIAPIDARREFISGFSGSAGIAVVTTEKAVLSTDGRYFNQAHQQLDSSWTLLKAGLPDVPTWQEWTAEQAEGGKTVGVDPSTISAPEGRKLAEKVRKQGGKDVVAINANLVDEVWGSDKPARPNEPVMVLGLEYAGQPYHEKLEKVREELEKKNASAFVVSMLDEVAWLFNLRGHDIPFNPVFFSYAVVTPTTATLYIDSSKLDETARKHLEGVQIRPYDAIFSDLVTLSSQGGDRSSARGSTASSPKRKYLMSTRGSWALSQALGDKKNVEEVRSPICDAKAIKNATELDGMRACHVRDGAALIRYFAWLEDELVAQRHTLDEVQVADQLAQFRAEHAHFVGLSFPTISSAGANAAVIHYSPTRGHCAAIDPAQIYLCDSGAQYRDGTTDTTRTLHWGTPSPAEREAYTLVLKGNIAVETAVFPRGTSGLALDALARQFLWARGLDYRHGTGHGVGSFLNVHEGPVGIGTRVQYAEVPLAPGNVLSNEPGYYEDGRFGIRIENVLLVREVPTKHRFGDKPYLGFEHVTMVPMCRKLIDADLLTARETAWLNAYHQEVLTKTRPFFATDERSRKWLERECAPY